MIIPPQLIAYGAVALIVGAYVMHCEHTKSNMAKASAIAEQQQIENNKIALRDIKAKERADENYQRRIGRLAADVKRLRDASAVFLPTPSPGSADSARTHYDRADVDAALRAHRAGIIELLGEGQAAVEGLDEARIWAAGR